MEILSHALWTNLIFKELPAEQKYTTVLFSILPDMISFSTVVSQHYIKRFKEHKDVQFTTKKLYNKVKNHKGVPQEEIPPYVFLLYDITHSIFIWGGIFVILKFFGLNWWATVMYGWLLHIVFDIFTHTADFLTHKKKSVFSTYVFWPFSRFHFPGIKWSNVWFLIINYAILAILYFIYYF